MLSFSLVLTNYDNGYNDNNDVDEDNYSGSNDNCNNNSDDNNDVMITTVMMC